MNPSTRSGTVMTLQDEVAQENSEALYQREYDQNIQVAKERVRANFGRPFTLYGGGNVSRMIGDLRVRGVTAVAGPHGFLEARV